MANYHYVAGGQALGPISEGELDEMVASGKLGSDTLIWSDGMAEWQSYAVVRRAGGASGGGTAVAVAAPPVTGGVVCVVCQQAFAPDQVIRYGASYVCGNCKPQFLQRLREGAPVGDRLEYATFGKRFAAKLVDTVLLYAVTIGLDLAVRAGVGAPPNSIPVFLATFTLNMMVSLAYPIFFLGKWGQTLGKMALSIKVVNADGTPITYGKAVGRVLAEMVTGFTIGIGYLMAAWDAERRALHDRLAGTRVVNAPRK